MIHRTQGPQPGGHRDSLRLYRTLEEVTVLLPSGRLKQKTLSIAGGGGEGTYVLHDVES